MKIQEVPFCIVDWSAIEPTEHVGERGTAFWRTQYFDPQENSIRVRTVEYSAGYISDHWCSKGHVLLCLSGELETTLADGRLVVLKPGMSYQFADNAEAHQSRTETGAELFIVD